jgi:hypothetical protein
MRNSGPRSDEIWLCISRGDPQVVTSKGPMAVALGACDYCKIWGWLRLKLLSEGILPSIERDTCIMQNRNCRVLIETFPGGHWRVCIAVLCPGKFDCEQEGCRDPRAGGSLSCSSCDSLAAVRVGRSRARSTRQRCSA